LRLDGVRDTRGTPGSIATAEEVFNGPRSTSFYSGVQT
jgi:hypothetical protein